VRFHRQFTKLDLHNGIFSIDVPIVIRWDAVASRLAIRFGAGVARSWYRSADTVVAATSPDGALAEMRFSEVGIVDNVAIG
jgi:hypothetical protein